MVKKKKHEEIVSIAKSAIVNEERVKENADVFKNVMDTTINGFKEPEIFRLYAFLVAYEESGIGKHRKSTKRLLQEHPELKELEENFKLVKYHKANNDFMQVLEFKKLRNKVYLTKSRGNLQLALLAHLRNAIAHGNVVEHCKKVLVTDHPIARPTDFSARGCLDIEVINEFTKTIKKIEL